MIKQILIAMAAGAMASMASAQVVDTAKETGKAISEGTKEGADNAKAAVHSGPRKDADKAKAKYHKTSAKVHREEAKDAADKTIH